MGKSDRSPCPTNRDTGCCCCCKSLVVKKLKVHLLHCVHQIDGLFLFVSFAGAVWVAGPWAARKEKWKEKGTPQQLTTTTTMPSNDG